MRVRPLHLAALILALATARRAAAQAAVGDEGAPPSAYVPAAETPPAAPPGAKTPLTAALAIVRAIDLERHRVVLEVQGGIVQGFDVDRNTLVYLPSGLATLYQLRTGDEVRAAWNATDVLYWVQVRQLAPAQAPAHSTPGQGTGPGGGAAAPPERSAPTAPAPPSGPR